MDRQTKDDEEREQELLKEQIERASKLAEEKGLDKEHTATELKRSESQNKIKLNLSLKPNSEKEESPEAQSSSTSSSNIPATTTTTIKKPGNKMKLMMGGIKKQESSSQPSSSTNDKKPAIKFGLGKRKPTDNVLKTSLDKKIKSSS